MSAGADSAGGVRSLQPGPPAACRFILRPILTIAAAWAALGEHVGQSTAIKAPIAVAFAAGWPVSVAHAP